MSAAPDFAAPGIYFSLGHPHIVPVTQWQNLALRGSRRDEGWAAPDADRGRPQHAAQRGERVEAPEGQ